MRPDQDPRLTELGIGQITCDKCLMELYPDEDDSICDDCDLNAINKGMPIEQFIKETSEHEKSFSLGELKERHAKMKKKEKNQ